MGDRGTLSLREAVKKVIETLRHLLRYGDTKTLKSHGTFHCQQYNTKKIQNGIMLRHSNNKMPRVSIGDSVTIPIPAVDRTRGEFYNILTKIVDINEHGQLKLGNRAGLLKDNYEVSAVTKCSSIFEVSTSFKYNLQNLRNIASQLEMVKDSLNVPVKKM
ncbi:hypothetical protein A3Q56_06557 [Intoshia linei]|uniref:Uncharacterized protein n=1 Tax=Intoshia linei TaxID=1819745 RepID=A0A177AWG5_9BILA|nr:hypothetical protein A3Q56_06557 [Intoshia linei]